VNRLVLTVIVASFFVLPALAQQPQAPDKTVDLSVTVPEAQLLLNALAKGPWSDVNPLMQKLVAQANAQLAPVATKAAAQPTTESKSDATAPTKWPTKWPLPLPTDSYPNPAEAAPPPK
jgi:hypothetical protein